MQALIAALLVLTTAQETPQKASPSGKIGESQALIVTYSDGRTNMRLLRPVGASWTSMFPRQKNAPPQGDLPLAALKFEHVLEGDAAIVTVSLLYGHPHQSTVAVATARVAGSDPVEVKELSAYGVDPISLSLGPLPAELLVQPTVASASPLLNASVDLALQDLPVYEVVFRNQSTRAVMAVGFRMLRDGKEIGSGRRKTNRNTPIVEPASEYSFTVRAVGSTARGFERFEVTGVLWDDGSVEGDPALKASEEALTVGYAQQLRRVLAILAESAAADGSTPRFASLAQIRSAIDALPIESADPALPPAGAGNAKVSVSSVKIGQQQVKEAVLQDLSEHLRAHAGTAHPPVQPWVDAAVAQYSAWLDRTGSR